MALFMAWKQEMTRVRILISDLPLGITLTGTVTELDGDFLTISGADFSFSADLDGATFEEENLPFPVCVRVAIRGEARLIPERFGEVRFLLCELP